MATPPRCILPGATKFVTRRCSERRFFLRPSPTTNAIVLYVLAIAAERCGVLVHACCVMSNHIHIVLTDVEARLPEFMAYLDMLIARAVNTAIGHSDKLWDGSGYSEVTLEEPQDVVAKMAYVLANPVAAGLVRRGELWPGVWTGPEQIGTRLTVEKPKGFFDPRSYLPAVAELELTVPPGFASADEFRARLAEALRALEEKHQRELASRGRRFLGAARVRAVDPFASPLTAEPRFKLNPRVAAKDKWTRIGALFRRKVFQEQHRKARVAWCAGMRDVLFPAGTYLMRIMYGVQCAGAA